MSGTITITFGDNVENHVGNQQIGKIADFGIPPKKLKQIQKKLKDKYECKYIDLRLNLSNEYKEDASEAGILLVKNFVNIFFEDDDESCTMFDELKNLEWDKKAIMKGKVVNKKARYNLCFSDFAQEPDYENGKGRVYNFNNLKKLLKIKKFLKKIIGEDLNAEGNFYYNTDTCYIGYHGDTERKIVVGIRLGEIFPLYYRWYKNTEPVSDQYKINLHPGDLYIMSDKAVGFDWKKRNILTLRHAAGNIF